MGWQAKKGKECPPGCHWPGSAPPGLLGKSSPAPWISGGWKEGASPEVPLQPFWAQISAPPPRLDATGGLGGLSKALGLTLEVGAGAGPEVCRGAAEASSCTFPGQADGQQQRAGLARGLRRTPTGSIPPHSRARWAGERRTKVACSTPTWGGGFKPTHSPPLLVHKINPFSPPPLKDLERGDDPPRSFPLLFLQAVETWPLAGQSKSGGLFLIFFSGGCFELAIENTRV